MTTPNMNLTLPVVSQTPGPTWASEINDDLSIIDAHNHAGSGALVPVAGLDINADLSLATHALTNATKAVFLDQVSVATLNALYAVGGDLYWTDGGGAPVQITSNGTVNVGPTGNISGMILSCAVNYVSGSLSYEFYDENGSLAFLVGSGVNISGVSVISPIGASAYTITLPSSPPASVPSLLGFSASGAMSNVAPDASLTVTSSTVGVAPLGVQTSNIANAAITTIKLADGSVTKSKQAAAGELISSSCGTYVRPNALADFPVTNLLVSYNSFTTRPILLTLQPNTGAAESSFRGDSLLSNSKIVVYIYYTGPGGISGEVASVSLLTTNSFSVPTPTYAPSSVQAVFQPPAAGTYTFEVFAREESDGTIYFDDICLAVVQF